VAEGGGLLNRYRVVKPYRGFESLRLRHLVFVDAMAPRALFRNVDVIGEKAILMAPVHRHVRAFDVSGI
jgi:hypothetical protein